MPRVRNLSTGLEHDVPAGHFSLTDVEYEVVREPVKVEAAPVADAGPKPVSRARKPRKE